MPVDWCTSSWTRMHDSECRTVWEVWHCYNLIVSKLAFRILQGLYWYIIGVAHHVMRYIISIGKRCRLSVHRCMQVGWTKRSSTLGSGRHNPCTSIWSARYRESCMVGRYEAKASLTREFLGWNRACGIVCVFILMLCSNSSSRNIIRQSRLVRKLSVVLLTF